jgi:polyisoprenoid-binding protein YceI
VKLAVKSGQLVLRAKSPVEEVTAKLTGLEGSVRFEPDDLSQQARAEISVDLKKLDAGDQFRNWELAKELDVKNRPTVKFVFNHFADVRESAAGIFEGTAVGQLNWNEKYVDVRITGTARLDRRGMEISGGFEVDMHDFGLKAPKFQLYTKDGIVVVRLGLMLMIEK